MVSWQQIVLAGAAPRFSGDYPRRHIPRVDPVEPALDERWKSSLEQGSEDKPHSRRHEVVWTDDSCWIDHHRIETLVDHLSKRRFSRCLGSVVWRQAGGCCPWARLRQQIGGSLEVVGMDRTAVSHATHTGAERRLGNVANPIDIDPAYLAIRVAGNGDEGSKVIHRVRALENDVETGRVEDITMCELDIKTVEGWTTVEINRPDLPALSQ